MEPAGSRGSCIVVNACRVKKKKPDILVVDIAYDQGRWRWGKDAIYQRNTEATGGPMIEIISGPKKELKGESENSELIEFSRK